MIIPNSLQSTYSTYNRGAAMKPRFLKTSKLNEFRLWGLFLMLTGMAIMILGTSGILMWGIQGRAFAGICMTLGMIVLLGSVAIYFWAGILSINAVMLTCPECEQQTKILGKTDRCMFCYTLLTLDPRQATE